MSRVFIQFDYNGILVNPETIHLNIGESLDWQLRIKQVPKQITEVIWEIYFPGKSPFGNTNFFQLQTPINQHNVIRGGTVGIAGDYKYGVRIIDAFSHNVIEDEDPYIIVR